MRASKTGAGLFRATRWGHFPIYIALLLCTAVAATAQTIATLQGRVIDVSGAALSNASITIRNARAGFETMVSSDAEGRYNVPAIPPGQYEVTVSADGFQP